MRLSAIRLHRIGLLSLALLSAASGTGRSQATQGNAPVNPPQAASAQIEYPLCHPEAIDATFAFADQPAGEQTVTLFFRNTSNASCRLQGEPAPSFAVDGHSMHVERCWLCAGADQKSPYPDRIPENRILLAPGKQAAVDLHWASAGDSCQTADWVVFSMTWGGPTGYIFTPFDRFMRICSPVTSSGYHRAADSSAYPTLQEDSLKVSVIPETIYSDESAELRVELAGGSEAAVKPKGCAEIYTVRHDPQGATRLDPLPTSDFSRLVSLTPEEIEAGRGKSQPIWMRGKRRDCETRGKISWVKGSIPAEQLAKVTHIEWRIVSQPNVDPTFLIVPTHFTVMDVETLNPNWGEPKEGIRAGLSIDNKTVHEGDLIRLHLRWENVSASSSIGQGECGEPHPEVEIQDSEHHVLQVVPEQPTCMGHGWGPFGIEKGKPQRSMVELFTTSPSDLKPVFYQNALNAHLPGPGIYYLVTVWSPRILDATKEDKMMRRAGTMGNIYATARSSPVQVEVLP